MVIHYLISHYDMGGWHAGSVIMRSGLQAANKYLEQAGAKAETLHAVLTSHDVEIMADNIVINPFFSERFRMHMDGMITVETEAGMKPIPFGIVDAPCYSNGFRLDDLQRAPIELLRQIESYRRKSMAVFSGAEHAIAMCQAIVAQAYGFPGRSDWTDMLKQESGAWPEQQASGLRLLSVLQRFYQESDNRKIPALWAIAQCQELIAVCGGLHHDWRDSIGKTPIERRPLFTYAWEDNALTVNRKIVKWCDLNNHPYRTDGNTVSVGINGDYHTCNCSCTEKEISVFAEVYRNKPAPLPVSVGGGQDG